MNKIENYIICYHPFCIYNTDMKEENRKSPHNIYKYMCTFSNAESVKAFCPYNKVVEKRKDSNFPNEKIAKYHKDVCNEENP